MTKGWTAIGVKDETKERFDRVKPDEWRSADSFVEHLLEYYEHGGEQ